MRSYGYGSRSVCVRVCVVCVCVCLSVCLLLYISLPVSDSPRATSGRQPRNSPAHQLAVPCKRSSPRVCTSVLFVSHSNLCLPQGQLSASANPNLMLQPMLSNELSCDLLSLETMHRWILCTPPPLNLHLSPSFFSSHSLSLSLHHSFFLFFSLFYLTTLPSVK